MGTINYGSNDYINLGIKPYDYDDFEQDREYMEEIQAQIDEYGGSVEDAINDYINELYECDYMNISHELQKHKFYYYHVTIENGYYEGLYLSIENNFPIALDNWEDKREMNKEITEMKHFLIECAGMGMVQYFPGWCMGYSNYADTLQAINAAIKNMRDEVKNTPTWRQYERG